MLSNSYAQYIKGLIALVRSITFKSVHTMNTMNTYLKAGGDTIPEHPTGYKYYLNLNGEYYVSSNGVMDDPVLKTFSPDTDSVIILTKDILVSHPKLRNRLKRRDALYNTLIATYPESQVLINGIINPTPIETAMAANDWQILYYDKRYLGVGETNVMDKLQHWVYNFAARWDVKGYRLCDPLYPAGLFGILGLNLVSELINVRLENCGTEYVHEYHLWNYLGGWFELDKYRANISHEQALFLYRNIRYIVDNGGTKEVLELLNDNLIKGFGLTLNKFEIHRATDTTLINLQNGDLDALDADVLVTKQPYSQSESDVSKLQQSSTSTLIQRMIDQGTNNRLNVLSDISNTNTKASGSAVSNIPTGIMECIPEGVTAANIVHKDRLRITTWLYLASTGNIAYNYNITLPGENLYNFPLTPSDAAIFLLYASAKIFGLEGTDVPKPVITGIDCIPSVSENELRGLVYESILVGKADDGTVKWDHYQDILNTVRLAEVMSAPEDFDAFITDLYNKKIMQWVIPQLHSTALGRGQLKALIRAFNTDHVCVFTDTTSYAEYFVDIGVDISTYSKQSLHNLVSLILQNYLGVEPEGISANTLTQNIIEILRTLSSYTVNYINSDQLDPPINIDWCFSIPSLNGLYIEDYVVQELVQEIKCEFNNNVRYMADAVHTFTHDINNVVLTSTASGAVPQVYVANTVWGCPDPLGSEINCVVTMNSNDQQLPTVNLYTDVTTGYENNNTVITVQAVASAEVTENQYVYLSFSGQAVLGNDYTAGGAVITIYSGTTSGELTLTVSDDVLVEDIEVVTITISSLSPGLLYGPYISRNVNIVSDDVVPPITVELIVNYNVNTISEVTIDGDPGTPISFVCYIEASSPVQGDQTAEPTITGNVDTNDYLYYGTTFTIPDGQTVSNEIMVVAVNDVVVEGDEQFVISITNLSSGIAPGTVTARQMTLLDNDVTLPTVEVNLELSSYSVSETGQSFVELIITTTAAVDNDETIDLTISGVNVTLGDFVNDGPFGTFIGTFTISAGQDTVSCSFNIADDALIEGTEIVLFALSNPSSGLTLGSASSQQLEIVDNDVVTLPVVNLTLSSYYGDEGTTPVVNVIITSTAAVTGNQSVTLQITGTNVTSDDYVLSSNTITIPNGFTSGHVTFTVVNDTLAEASEYVLFTITSPTSGITLGEVADKTYVISDNDSTNAWNEYVYYNGVNVLSMRTSITGAIIYVIANTATGQFLFRSLDKGATLVNTGTDVPSNMGTWSMSGDATKIVFPINVGWMQKAKCKEFDPDTNLLVAINDIYSVPDYNPIAPPNPSTSREVAPALIDWPMVLQDGSLKGIMKLVAYKYGVNPASVYNITSTADYGISYSTPSGLSGFTPPLNYSWFYGPTSSYILTTNNDGSIWYVYDYINPTTGNAAFVIYATFNGGATWVTNTYTYYLSPYGLKCSNDGSVVLLPASKVTSPPSKVWEQPLYISHDYAVTFTEITTLMWCKWGSFDMSDDGDIIAIIGETWEVTGQLYGADHYGPVCRLFVSRDAGNTWVVEKLYRFLNGKTKINYQVAVAADGHTIFVLDKSTNSISTLTL